MSVMPWHRNRQTLLRYLSIHSVSALALAACAEEDPGAARCEDTVNVVAPDDVTYLGTTTTELMSNVLGTWQCEVTWHDGVENLPDAGTTDGDTGDAVLNLAFEGGEIREILSKRVGGTKLDRLACGNSLEMDLVFGLTSSDGRLAETWQVTAETTEARFMGVRYVPESFAGTYHYTIQGDWPNQGTSVSTSFLIESDPSTNTARGSINEWTESQPATEADALGRPITEVSGMSVTTAEWVCSR
jgi:hypothetical protein